MEPLNREQIVMDKDRAAMVTGANGLLENTMIDDLGRLEMEDPGDSAVSRVSSFASRDPVCYTLLCFYILVCLLQRCTAEF